MNSTELLTVTHTKFKSSFMDPSKERPLLPAVPQGHYKHLHQGAGFNDQEAEELHVWQHDCSLPHELRVAYKSRKVLMIMSPLSCSPHDLNPWTIIHGVSSWRILTSSYMIPRIYWKHKEELSELGNVVNSQAETSFIE